MKQIFESSRIRYASVSEDLVQDYLTMVNDNENVARFIGGPHEPYTEEKERKWVREKLKENANVFSMIEKRTGDFIGNIELMDLRDSVAELGIAITAKKQELGYGSEAIRAIVHYGFNYLGLNRIFLKVYPDNFRAIHVYEKCGFREYDRTEEDVFMEITRSADEKTSVNGKTFQVVRLLGKGKGGYSYLVNDGEKNYVLKQIHHEPCDYYSFGNKLEAELRDYETLRNIGIPMPRLLDVDTAQERILKEYIAGQTVADWINEGRMEQTWLEQVQDMCSLLYPAGLNIDYFPNNFVPQGDRLYYIDYECNTYMEQWDFEHWGRRYWSVKELVD